MRKDLLISIRRGRSAEVWKCRAQADRLGPGDSDVDEDARSSAPRMKIRFHYARPLDPVLADPTKYNCFVLNRRVASTTILSIQQTACGRYVELRV